MANPEASVVECLVYAALTGMENVDVAYGDRELLSAAFTVLIRCSEACIKNNETLRQPAIQAAQIILMKLADPGKMV